MHNRKCATTSAARDSCRMGKDKFELPITAKPPDLGYVQPPPNSNIPAVAHDGELESPFAQPPASGMYNLSAQSESSAASVPTPSHEFRHSVVETDVNSAFSQHDSEYEVAAANVRETMPVLLSSYAIPNSKDDASKSSIPIGAIYTPAVEMTPAPPIIRRPVIRCKECQAALNLFCKVDRSSRKWKCSFCRGMNSPGEHGFIDESYQSCPELVKKAVDYVDTNVQGYTGNVLPRVCVLVVDANMTENELSTFKISVEHILDALDESVIFGLVTFGNLISVYNLSSSESVAAEVFPGICSPTNEDIVSVMREQASFAVPLNDECKKAVKNALSCLRPKKETSLLGGVGEGQSYKRCVGAATELALALTKIVSDRETKKLQTSHPIGGQLLLCLTGAPNFGPGAVPPTEAIALAAEIDSASAYYRGMSAQGYKYNVGVDVVCVGHANFRTEILQNLVKGAGGSLLLIPEFKKDKQSAFVRDCIHLLKKLVGYRGQFSVRTPPCLAVARVIGPAALHAEDVESSAAMPHSIPMSSVQRKHAYTIVFQHEEDIPEDEIYIQFTASYIDQRNRRVTRIVTQKLQVTGNMKTYLRCIDVASLSVISAKLLVTMARKGEIDGTNSARSALEQNIKDIADFHGETIQGGRKMFPSELNEYALNMYLLRKGPMLGLVFQHPDEIDSLRSFFLSTNGSDGGLLAVPNLYSPKAFAPGECAPEFEQLPVESMAMQSNRILVMDAFSDIFIWSGSLVAGPEYEGGREACAVFVQTKMADRFPTPKILSFNEGTSQARWLHCRVTPTHKDSVQEQNRSFPALQQMSDAERNQLISKFHRTDDQSFIAWLRSLNVFL